MTITLSLPGLTFSTSRDVIIPSAVTDIFPASSLLKELDGEIAILLSAS